MIFAIAGRQMWQGLFYRRCTNLNYGYFYSTYKYNYMCTFDTDCQDLNSYGVKNICSKGYLNPDSGAFNFDNVLTGFVTVFAMATLEGWTDIFTYVSKTFKDKIYINPIIIFCYFHFFIFLSSFYMLKLFLAITNAEYEHIEVSRREFRAPQGRSPRTRGRLITVLFRRRRIRRSRFRGRCRDACPRKRPADCVFSRAASPLPWHR